MISGFDMRQQLGGIDVPDRGQGDDYTRKYASAVCLRERGASRYTGFFAPSAELWL